MIEMRHLKNVVIFSQTILSFVPYELLCLTLIIQNLVSPVSLCLAGFFYFIFLFPQINFISKFIQITVFRVFRKIENNQIDKFILSVIPVY